MSRHLRWSALLIAVAVAIGAMAAPSVDIGVAPMLGFEPATARIRVTVEPREDYRWLEIVADSGQHFRSSGQVLEGDRGPRTTWVTWDGLPAGEYEVIAVVFDARGRQVARGRRTARVISRF